MLVSVGGAPGLKFLVMICCMFQIHSMSLPSSPSLITSCSTPSQPLMCHVSMWTGLEWRSGISPDPQLLVCCVSGEDDEPQTVIKALYSALWVFKEDGELIKVSSRPTLPVYLLAKWSLISCGCSRETNLQRSNLTFGGILHSLNNCTANEIACTPASSWSHEGWRTIQEQVCGQ